MESEVSRNQLVKTMEIQLRNIKTVTRLDLHFRKLIFMLE